MGNGRRIGKLEERLSRLEDRVFDLDTKMWFDGNEVPMRDILWGMIKALNLEVNGLTVKKLEKKK